MLGHADLHAERLLDDHEFQVTAGRQGRFAGRCRGRFRRQGFGFGGRFIGHSFGSRRRGDFPCRLQEDAVLVAACAAAVRSSPPRIAFPALVRAAAGEFPPPVAVVPGFAKHAEIKAEQRQAMQQD